MEDVNGGVRRPGGIAAVVRGEVLGPDRKPVAGARVVITRSPVPVPDLAAVTDAMGRFALTAPAPGEYVFTAHSATAGPPATGSVNVPATGTLATSSDAMDSDADMGSDDDTPETAAPSAAATEIYLILSLPAPPEGDR